MKCEDVQLLLTDYIDNELDTVYCYAVETHIKNCAACANEVEELRVVLQDIADTKQKMPGASLRNNFNAMLEAELNLSAKEKATQQREVRKVMIMQWASSLWKIAAAVVILFIGVWLGGKGKPVVTQGASDTQLAALQKDVKTNAGNHDVQRA